MQTANLRESRGEAIAKRFGWVRRMDEHFYKVHSQSGDFEYEVMSTEMGWLCSCPDAMFRGSKCKHIIAVELSYILRKIVAREQVTIQPISVSNCPSCNSENVVKHGLRHNKCGDLQRFSCKGCGSRFVVNLGFEKVHSTPQAITSAMQLYFTGESLRSVQKFLRLQGVNVSHVCVYKWIGKYVKLMEGYLDQIRPQVSDKWRTDELYLKVKGNRKYLFAMLDDETRFWIAQQITDNKGTSDVRPMFRAAKERAGKTPAILISDGAHNFHLAYNREYWTHFKPRTEHIRDVHFAGHPHNNKMERFNGELRDREKTMRSLKTSETQILKGMQIHHNFIRAHEGLDGRTPAEACGIKVEGDNKWLTIIQNASHVPKLNSEKKSGCVPQI
ncbi:MAG: DDE-type integrase/transposase/recombinase [Candidatus Bathyarchaeia archaeon]|jgi:transposase-like protein